jgi:hypothetical protein
MVSLRVFCNATNSVVGRFPLVLYEGKRNLKSYFGSRGRIRGSKIMALALRLNSPRVWESKALGVPGGTLIATLLVDRQLSESGRRIRGPVSSFRHSRSLDILECKMAFNATGRRCDLQGRRCEFQMQPPRENPCRNVRCLADVRLPQPINCNK